MSGIGPELVGFAVDVALKVTVVLTLASIADLALRRSSAALRHLVWAVAVAGVLAIPVASAVLPSLPTPLWPDLGSAVTQTWAGTDAEPRVDAPDAGASPSRVADDPAGEAIAPLEDSGPAGAVTTGSAGPVEAISPVVEGAVTPPAVPESTGSIGWTSGLALAWAVGLLLVLLALARERVGLRTRARRDGPFGPGRVRERARVMADRMGLSRIPRLIRLGDGAMPATWGVLRHTVALPAGADNWDDERLESVLAHEMAHVRRRDCAVQTAAVLACALYWFHPLAWVAAARLRRERELAADDEVLALGTRPTTYASELLALARAAGRIPVMTATAMGAKDGLARRIRSVVSGETRRRAVTGALVAGAAVVGALLLLPLASLSPARAVVGDLETVADGLRIGAGAVAEKAGHEAQAAAERMGSESESWSSEVSTIGPVSGPEECWNPAIAHHEEVHAHGERYEAKWESDGCESEIRVDGEIGFTADFTGVRTVSGGGVLRVKEKTDEYRRAVEYVSGPGGTARRTFRRDGDVAEPTAAEEAWIRERLVTVLRRTGIAAGRRTAWILARSGPDGVLAEIERIASDRVAGLYVDALLARAGLDDGELRRLLAVAGKQIGSDGQLSETLIRIVRRYPDGVAGPAREAFREAAATVGSDGSMGRLVGTMVALPEAEADMVELALEVAASGIGSDGEMARFLRRTVERHGALVTGAVREDFGEAAATVGSDGSLGGVVREMVAAGPHLVGPALDLAAAGIGSDGEMARFLRAAVERHPALIAGANRDAFLSAARTVGSDGSLGSVVRLMAESPGASPELIGVALAASASIGSDGEMAGFLAAVARRHPALVRPGGPLDGPFERALASVGSDGEEDRVRRALARGG